MLKSELIIGLATINDAELVLFRLPNGTVFTPASIEVQQEEPPIHAVVVVTSVTNAALQAIKEERQAARDAAVKIEADRIAAEKAAEAARQEAVDVAFQEMKDRLLADPDVLDAIAKRKANAD